MDFYINFPIDQNSYQTENAFSILYLHKTDIDGLESIPRKYTLFEY